VVNVTWRGKTYVGTLLDCTRHDWAPPRYCLSDLERISSVSRRVGVTGVGCVAGFVIRRRVIWTLARRKGEGSAAGQPRGARRGAT